MTFVWSTKAGLEEVANHSKSLIFSIEVRMHIENGYSAQRLSLFDKISRLKGRSCRVRWRNTDIQVECWVLEIPDPLAVSIFNSD
jgi:trehalose utilization protein